MLRLSLIHALPRDQRRGLSRKEAASYAGVSPGYFNKLVRLGHMPEAMPFPGVKRWDKHALDRHLDVMNGSSSTPVSAPIDEYDAWKQSHG